MPDPYSGAYFGIDEDPMGQPGGQTAAGAFARAYPERSGTQPMPWSRGPRDSSGVTGGISERNRTFWDLLFGRAGREYAGPREAYGPPGGGGAGMPTELHPSAALPPQGAGESPQSYGPPMPPIKPVTALSSGSDLAERIRALISPATPPSAPQLGMPGSWEGTQPVRDVPYEMPGYVTMPNPRVPRQYDQAAAPTPIRDLARRVLPGMGTIDRRAEGGPIAQRGGYPELYTQPVRQQGYFATGGASNYVAPDGQGDGRSDHIEARLSPGEYVFDAETTALLGDGDSAAGARKLDKMRESVRKQKGAKLAKGDISPKAKKHAEEYLSAGLSRSALKNAGR